MLPDEQRQAASWEQCKENVQPLRHGRNVAALNSSLQTGSDEQLAQKIAHQRREFELEIRTYGGDDPLEPWYQYLLWTEQHCPRGGHHGNLDALLERCIRQFRDQPRYTQDPRYVSFFLKLAASSPMWDDIYTRMVTSCIGTKLTMFYTAWSAQLELTGNMRRADAILQEAERQGAQPADQLAEARRKLQQRVAAALAAGQLPGAAAQPAATDHQQQLQARQAFSVLSAGADGEQVPRARVGAAVVGRPGAMPVGGSGHSRPQRANTARPHVFVDENGAAAAPAAPHRAAHRPHHHLPAAAKQAVKENVRQAGPWGAPQPAAARPAVTPAPAFKVFEEEASGARGSPITANPSALSTRAGQAPSVSWPWDAPVAVFEPPNPNTQAMYCKDVIYAGAGEVSFEELRAQRWIKQHATEMEFRRQQEAMARALQEAQRRQRQLEAQMADMQNQLLQQQQAAAAAAAARPQPPARAHNSLSCSNVSTGSSSVGVNSGGASILVAASPTVNTRHALNYVRELMNNTVDSSMVHPPPAPRKSLAPPSRTFQIYEEPQEADSATPFKIYEEPQEPTPPVTVYEEPTPFKIYEEPQAPTGGPRPSMAFQVYEDNQQQGELAAAVDAGDSPPTTPACYEESGDSDKENFVPAGTAPPVARTEPLAGVLVDAVDVPLPSDMKGCPSIDEEPPPAEVDPAEAAGARAPVQSQPRRRTLQFDDELTGFVPLSSDLTLADPMESEFVAAAGRVTSTPFVQPLPPPLMTGDTAGQRRNQVEDGEFTANLRMVSVGAKCSRRSELIPITEVSRERFKSSSSSSGSDASRQSRYCDMSAPGARADATARSRCASAGTAGGEQEPWPPRAGSATAASGYLGDRSASVAPHHSLPAADTSAAMSRRPEVDRTGDVSNISVPAPTPQRHGKSAVETGHPSPIPELPPSPMEPVGDLPSSPIDAGVDGAPAEPNVVPSPPAEASVAYPLSKISMMPSAADVMPTTADDLSVMPPPVELSLMAPPAEPSMLPPPAGSSELVVPAVDQSVEVEVVHVNNCEAVGELSLREEPPVLEDPWDAGLQQQLLDQLQLPLLQRPGFVSCAQKLPSFSQKEIVLDGRRLSLALIGEGSYAHIYRAIDQQTGAAICLKVQRGSPLGGQWEFYVLDELRRRLPPLGVPAECVMAAEAARCFSTGSVLSSEFEPAGSLLTALNRLRSVGRVPDALAQLLTADMLAIVDAVHRASVLHADVKPDNFLLRSSALSDPAALLERLADAGTSSPPALLQLIDFGRAIDLTLLPPGARFRRVVTTDSFTCPAMLDGRPWRVHADLFGVAASAYVVIFGQYLKLRRDAAAGGWTFAGTIPRYANRPLWTEFFRAFLNIPEGSAAPDLRAWRARFLEAATAPSERNSLVSKLSALARRLLEH